MKVFKTACAFLLSIMLMLAQTVFASSIDQKSSEKCNGCACAQMRCCGQPASAPSQPAQSIPTPSQTQIHFIASVIYFLPLPDTGLALKQLAAFSLPSSFTAVALFTRDCSYLI